MPKGLKQKRCQGAKMKKAKEIAGTIGMILFLLTVAFINFYADAWWTNFKVEWFNG